MRTTKPFSQERWEFWLDFMQVQLHPNFTTTGYQVKKVPGPLNAKLRAFFKKNYGTAGGSSPEGEVPYFITGDRKMVPMSEDLSSAVTEGVQSIHEEWGGTKLEPTAFYGIRTYENGSTLAMHVDR